MDAEVREAQRAYEAALRRSLGVEVVVLAGDDLKMVREAAAGAYNSTALNLHMHRTRFNSHEDKCEQIHKRFANMVNVLKLLGMEVVPYDKIISEFEARRR